MHIEYMHHIGAFLQGNHLFHPSIHNSPGYAKALRVTESIAMNAPLVQAYKSMCGLLEDEIAHLESYRGVNGIVVPPIPALVLSRIDTPDQIMDELLALRARFSSVRAAFREGFDLKKFHILICKSLLGMPHEKFSDSLSMIFRVDTHYIYFV